MSIEEIERFFSKKGSEDDNYVKISFKKRDPIYGLFVKDKDYSDLKSKNFWRIVPRSRFDEFSRSRNLGLARIFSGSEFTKLTPYQESFE